MVRGMRSLEPASALDRDNRYTDADVVISVSMDEQFLEATISIRGVVCRPDDRVLVVRRASDGGWELPGGRIYRTESVTDCLQRELREEVGVAVTVRRPVEAASWLNTAGKGRFAVYYHCTTDGRAEVALSDEHTDFGWVSKPTARDRLSEPQARATLRTTAAEAVE
jgi:8-oxo-dGTP pyrophosphatase MutT (NUDIX family)